MLGNTTRMMLGLAALWALSAGAAHAQQGSIGVSVITRPDIPVETFGLGLSTMPIGQAECRVDGEIEVRLSGIPNNTRRIDLWWGTGCEDEQRRGVSTVEGCEYLRNIELPTGQNNQRDLTLNAREIVAAATRDEVVTPEEPTGGPDAGIAGGDAGVPAADALCEGFTSTEYLYFLATNQAMSTAAVDSWGALEAQIDTDAPDAPGNVTTGVGERQIPVEWDLPTSGGILRYRLYWDPNAGDDCGSELLREGEPIPAGADLRSDEVETPTTNETTLDQPIAPNSQAALVVVSVDQAYNTSPASNVACMISMNTDGFWELYEGEGGTGKAGCSVGRLRREHASAFGLLALALGALSLRRRRSE